MKPTTNYLTTLWETSLQVTAAYRNIIVFAFLITLIASAVFRYQTSWMNVKESNMDGPDAVLATGTWSGGDANDTNWTSNDNWSGIGGAGVDDDLVFAAGAARKVNVNDFAVNTRFHSITISDTDYNISGNQIFLSAGLNENATNSVGANPIFVPNIILDNNQTFSNTGKTLNLNGVINLNGHQLLASGDANMVFNGLINGAGTLVLNSTAITTINGDSSGFGTTILNVGHLNVVSPGKLGQVDIMGGTLEGSGTVGKI